MNLKKYIFAILISANLIPAQSLFAADMCDPRSIGLLFTGFHMTKYGCQHLAQDTKKNQNAPIGQKIKNTVANTALISSGIVLMLASPFCVTYVDKKLGGKEYNATQENHNYFIGGAVAALLGLFTVKHL